MRFLNFNRSQTGEGRKRRMRRAAAATTTTTPPGSKLKEAFDSTVVCTFLLRPEIATQDPMFGEWWRNPFIFSSCVIFSSPGVQVKSPIVSGALSSVSIDITTTGEKGRANHFNRNQFLASLHLFFYSLFVSPHSSPLPLTVGALFFSFSPRSPAP